MPRPSLRTSHDSWSGCHDQSDHQRAVERRRDEPRRDGTPRPAPGVARNQLVAAVALIRRAATVGENIGSYLWEDNRDIVEVLQQVASLAGLEPPPTRGRRRISDARRIAPPQPRVAATGGRRCTTGCGCNRRTTPRSACCVRCSNECRREKRASTRRVGCNQRWVRRRSGIGATTVVLLEGSHVAHAAGRVVPHDQIADFPAVLVAHGVIVEIGPQLVKKSSLS